MRLKFVTLNIWNGGLLFDEAAKFLKEANPDVVVFQEVYSSDNQDLERRFRTLSELQKEFLQMQFAFGETVVDQGYGGALWGNAVFSKFPIIDKRNILFDNAPREFDFKNRNDFQNVSQGMIEAKIDLNGRQVYVYSWHGVWGTHGNDTPERDKMGDVIIREINGKSPVILAGDTNLLPTTNFVKRISEELELVNIFGTTLPSTFNMKHKDLPGYAVSAVDMVLGTSEFKVVSKEMPMADVSDHYPLVVEFEI